MLKTTLFPTLALILAAAPARAYNTAQHADFASDALAVLCGADAGAAGPLCAELAAYEPFLRFGAEMEDEGERDFRRTFGGVEFRDEEPGKHGPCKASWLYGERHMYCNHYFFVDNYLAGRPSGSCGSDLLDATTPDCGGLKPFQWESARERGLRLMEEKVLPNYLSGAADGKARAYYWLGRVSHLLADMSVPAHVVPHTINFMEFEHRVFEYEAGRVDAPGAVREATPGDLGGLFVELARRSLEVQAAARLDGCRRDPAVTGCDKNRATPTRPLESRLKIKNVLRTDAIMKGKQSVLAKPEIQAESVLARTMLAEIKPLTVLYTVRLLELFAEQAALKPVASEMPGFLPDASDPAPFRLPPDFDGAPAR